MIMKNSILYPIIVAVLIGISVLFIRAFPLNFDKLIVDYTYEVALLIVVMAIIAFVLCQGIVSFVTKDKKAEIQQLKAERDNYKESLEKLAEVDAETQRFRAIIQYKNDTNTD